MKHIFPQIESTNSFPQIIRSFFPFHPVIEDNSKSWGVCKFIPLSNLSYYDISLHVKLKNFNGFPLRMSFFRRFPTSLMLNELSIASQTSSIMKDTWLSRNFSGVDGFMLASVVKSFNITPILMKPNGTFGYKSSDGQFMGN